MGKGSWNGRPPTAFELSEINRREVEREVRHRRLSTLHSMGYETANVDGQWYYRLSGSDGHWTAMDNPDSYYNKYIK